MQTLAEIAIALGATDPAEATRAVVLLAAQAALRGATGYPLTPASQLFNERTIAAARDQLTPAAFATAWAEGTTLPLEQILADALDAPLPSS